MIQKVSFENLEIEIEAISDDQCIYRFIGDVDEHFIPKDVPSCRQNQLILDLAKIYNFNSCGIREWLVFLNQIDLQKQIVFKDCSVVMMDQINMVPESLGHGHVESFYAPYFCSGCGESNQLIDTHQHYQDLLAKKAPEFNCSQCDAHLEFDALEESYFLFVDEQVESAG